MIVVKIACNMDKIAPSLPTCFRFLTKNVSPIEKAIKDRVSWVIIKSFLKIRKIKLQMN